jgi:hypothetical protein
MSPADQVREAIRVASTPPESVPEWSQRILTITTALMLCAAFLLLQQVLQLNSAVHELQVQIDSARHERVTYQIQAQLRQCETMRAVGVGEVNLRKVGCAS